MALLTASYAPHFNAGGISINNANVNRTSDGSSALGITIPGAKPGELTTRSSDSAGTITLAADHGIETADVVDLYFEDGIRYGVTVGTVAGTSVPVSGGEGANLPAEDAAIIVAPVVQAELVMIGDNIVIIGMQAAGSVLGDRCHVDFHDSGGSAVQVQLAANGAFVLDPASGHVNVLAGIDIVEAWISTSRTQGVQFKLGALVDATP